MSPPGPQLRGGEARRVELTLGENDAGPSLCVFRNLNEVFQTYSDDSLGRRTY